MMSISQRAISRDLWTRISRLRRQRRIQTAMTLGLVFLGPVLVVATFLALGPLDLGGRSTSLRLILLADLVYVLVIATLVLSRVARMVADRRSQSAGSRLHLRLTGRLCRRGAGTDRAGRRLRRAVGKPRLEGWFSDRVRQVVGSSLEAAEAYEGEQRADLSEDATALAAYLNLAKQQSALCATTSCARC
jgi:two-component system nitrogen regulation sensor histidine kinase NtrY